MKDTTELRTRLTQLTRDLILIRSTDSNPVERERCMQLVRNHLESLEEVRLQLFKSNGYASLVALPDGVERPEILLCGHLDVIEHPSESAYQSTLRDGRIYGPGAGDMKGAVAILLELFREFHQSFSGLPLGLALTTDEERGGENGVRFLFQEQGLRCDLAIIPDGGSLNRVTVEEKGILHLRLHCYGRAGHAARPWLARNALDHLTRQLAKLTEHFEQAHPVGSEEDNDHWFPTCSLTRVETPNPTVNRIPGQAHAILDVRFPPPHTAETMRQEVSELLGPEIEVEVLVSAEPTHLAPDSRFCDITEQHTGHTVDLVRSSGGSDARFICADGTPVILSRPEVGNLHAPDEWIDVQSMVTYYRICWDYIRQRIVSGRR